MEAEPDGPAGPHEVVRVLPRARPDAEGDRHAARSLVHRPLRRQETARLNCIAHFLDSDPLQEGARARRSSCRSARTRARTTTRRLSRAGASCPRSTDLPLRIRGPCTTNPTLRVQQRVELVEGRGESFQPAVVRDDVEMERRPVRKQHGLVALAVVRLQVALARLARVDPEAGLPLDGEAREPSGRPSRRTGSRSGCTASASRSSRKRETASARDPSRRAGPSREAIRRSGSKRAASAPRPATRRRRSPRDRGAAPSRSSRGNGEDPGRTARASPRRGESP